MPYSESDLEASVRSALPVDYIKVEDQSDGCGGKFEITIVSR
jgi:stress-induced morphogen